MKRALWIFVLIFLGLSVFLAISAFGGGRMNRPNSAATSDQDSEKEAVAGRSFSGQFINNCGQIATSCIAFDRNDGITWDQDFGAGPELFVGTYNERRSGPNSFWFAALFDQSDDHTFFLGGYTIRSDFTIMLLVNADSDCPGATTAPIALGLYRDSDCIPGQRLGMSGEEGWIGGVGPDTE